ncbi:MAG: hypothetical protein KH415_12120 [Clostridium sp.]|nr:hypothetical protein [Clostridium sp.]
MKRISVIIILLMIILIVGCNLEEKKQFISDDYQITQDEEIKVNIESDIVLFYNEVVTFTPVVDGDSNKELQYHWILEDTFEEKDIHGFVSDEGPVYEIINSGEAVKFTSYADVSYTEDAYSEIKVILQIEEKETNNIIATDEATIINRQGEYFVKTSKEKELQEEILKTEKAKVYAKIFNIAWETDKGLNSDIKYVNIDTSTFKDFTGEDKTQLFYYLAKKYNVTLIDKTFQELESEGYIKNSAFIDGISFKIDEYIKNTENEILFEGSKWASGLGAIGFTTKAEKINGIWEIKKFNMTWIS